MVWGLGGGGEHARGVATPAKRPRGLFLPPPPPPAPPGRWVYEDGLAAGVPVGHSAVLCFMVGPLGLLCHLATKWVAGRWRAARGGGGDGVVIYHF